MTRTTSGGLPSIFLDDVEQEYLLDFAFDAGVENSWIPIANLVWRDSENPMSLYRLLEDDPQSSFLDGAVYTAEKKNPGRSETVYISRQGLSPFQQQAEKSPDRRSYPKVFLIAKDARGGETKLAISIDVRIDKSKPDAPSVTVTPVTDPGAEASHRYCKLATISLTLDKDFGFPGFLQLSLPTATDTVPTLFFIESASDTLKTTLVMSTLDVGTDGVVPDIGVGISRQDMQLAYDAMFPRGEEAGLIAAPLKVLIRTSPPAAKEFDFELPLEVPFVCRNNPDELIFKIGTMQRICLLEGLPPTAQFDELELQRRAGLTLNGESKLSIEYSGNKTFDGKTKKDCTVTLITDNGPRELTIPVKTGRTLTIEFSEMLKADAKLPWADVSAIEIRGSIGLKKATGPARQQPWTVAIPCNFAVPLPRYLYCVDFGTSATSIGILWINDQGNEEFVALPLGRWLEEIDSLHDESKTFDDDSRGELIPSHIGLSSDLHQRSRFDPLSLGSQAHVGSDPAAIGGRLKALDLSYDVSIPAASFSATTLFGDPRDTPKPPPEGVHNYVESAVWNLKTILLQTGRQVAVEGNIWSRTPDGQLVPTRSAGAEVLLRDYMRELGRYVVLRSANMARRGVVTSQQLSRIADGVLEAPGEDVGVVLTHPSGLSKARIGAYQAAGMAFLASVTGRAVNASLRRRVFLIPEAIAAAASTNQSEPTRELVVALDIGAGTYDVAVISEPGGASAKNWSVLADFAIHVAGRALDRKLAKLVAAMLQVAQQNTDIAQRFEIQPNLPESPIDIGRYGSDLERARGAEFLRAIRRAKAQVTTEALARPGPYRWPDDKPFRIRLGTPASGLRSPVRRNPRAGWSGNLSCDIPRANAKLIANADEIVLEIDRRVLSSMLPNLPPVVDAAARQYFDVLTLLGTEMPKLVAEELNDLLQDKLLKDNETKPAVLWRVTGRTSLWPPLFTLLDQQISACSGDTTVRRPTSPWIMKRSLVEGAGRLVVRGRHHSIRKSPSYAAVLAGSGMPDNGVERIEYLPTSEFQTLQELPFAAKEGARLVDALPSLNKNNAVLSLLTKIIKELPPSEPIAGPFNRLESIPPGEKTELRLEKDESGTRYEIQYGNRSMSGSFRGVCR